MASNCHSEKMQFSFLISHLDNTKKTVLALYRHPFFYVFNIALLTLDDKTALFINEPVLCYRRRLLLDIRNYFIKETTHWLFPRGTSKNDPFDLLSRTGSIKCNGPYPRLLLTIDGLLRLGVTTP